MGRLLFGPKFLALCLGIVTGLALVVWVDAGSTAIADLRIAHAKMAPLAAPDYALVRAAAFVPRDGGRLVHDGRFGVARITFYVSDPATADLALLVRRARDNYAVYVNGTLAAPVPGRLGLVSTLHGYHPRFIKLLPGLLRSGENTLDVLSARNATQTVLREVYFGPASRLQAPFLHTRLIVEDIGFIAALSAGMVLLFALALSSLMRNRALLVTVCTTLALFVLRELHSLWVDQPWPQMARDIYLLLVGALLWVSVAAFVNEWTSGPARYRRIFIAGAALCFAFVFGTYAVSPSCHEAYEASTWFNLAIALGAFAFIAYRLVKHYVKAPPSAAPEIYPAVVGLVMAFGVIVLTQTYYVPGMTGFSIVDGEAFTKLSALSMIVFIAIGLARQGVGVYQLATLNNETLERKVGEKEREIAASHALLRDQDRERTLATERGRIMRDVHDGIGSQLLGLMVQARAGSVPGEAMTAGLQSAIDDLYLVVDSLDGVDGALATALGTFRARVEPKCTAAGVELAWRVEDAGDAAPFGPAAVLQIYRILQEALSNALRHAGATQVTISLSRGISSALNISLCDNGRGFAAESFGGRGRGLANMRKRAASIGGDLRIESHAGGTCVHILLPAPLGVS